MAKYEQIMRVQDIKTGRFVDYRLTDVAVTLYVLKQETRESPAITTNSMIRVCEVLKPNQT